jgi:hypothetical protein
MVFVGELTTQMDDQQYWSHHEHCHRLAGMLSAAIDGLMHYIFQGKCKDPEHWEKLFKALNQAVFMKEYLSLCCSNVLTIAEDFLAQFEEWKVEVQAQLN